MTITFPVPVYPSQLPSIPIYADSLANSIADITRQKKISAFKRNDYLSIALGYKGHSDLIQSSKFRAEADSGELLMLLEYPIIIDAVSEVFSNKLDYLSTSDAIRACEQAKQKAPVKLQWFEDEAPMPHMNKGLKLLLDQSGSQPDKKAKPYLSIDISGAPADVIDAFECHPRVKSFLKEVRSVLDKGELSYSHINQNSSAFGRSYPLESDTDWKIQVSMDGWCKETAFVENWPAWTAFKEWFMSFYFTERVSLTERINVRSWRHMVRQTYTYISLEQVRDGFESTPDRILFDVMLAASQPKADNTDTIIIDPMGDKALLKALEQVGNPHLDANPEIYGEYFNKDSGEIEAQYGVTKIPDAGSVRYNPLANLVSKSELASRIASEALSGGEFDFQDIIAKAPLVYVDIDAIRQSPANKRILQNTISSMADGQARQIASERVRLQLICDEQSGTNLIDHCEHNVKDEMTGQHGTDVHCLVCGYRAKAVPFECLHHLQVNEGGLAGAYIHYVFGSTNGYSDVYSGMVDDERRKIEAAGGKVVISDVFERPCW